MSNTGRMDHYFPQWLMRNWCDETNTLWCYDKRSQQIKRSGTARFGRQKHLYKSDTTDLDLERTIFAEIDNAHGRWTRRLLLHLLCSGRQRVPNDALYYFAQLCLWTSFRNKRVREWIDVEWFVSSFGSDQLVHAMTEPELRKELHLQYCNLFHDAVMRSETRRLIKEFCCFFCYSRRQVYYLGQASPGVWYRGGGGMVALHSTGG